MKVHTKKNTITNTLIFLKFIGNKNVKYVLLRRYILIDQERILIFRKKIFRINCISLQITKLLGKDRIPLSF